MREIDAFDAISSDRIESGDVTRYKSVLKHLNLSGVYLKLTVAYRFNY